MSITQEEKSGFGRIFLCIYISIHEAEIFEIAMKK